MAGRSISAVAGSAKPADLAADGPPKLRPLDPWEKAAIRVLIGLGILLTVGTLGWFGLDHGVGGGFVSKAVTTTGAGSSAKVVEKDYSDTVVIFALTAGVTLVLAGALYGRLRDITLGELKVDVDDTEN
jgi:hypothetical protein